MVTLHSKILQIQYIFVNIEKFFPVTCTSTVIEIFLSTDKIFRRVIVADDRNCCRADRTEIIERRVALKWFEP